MSQQSPPKLLIAASALTIVALGLWLAVGPSTTGNRDSVTAGGVEWMVVADKPLDHESAEKAVPRGFCIPSQEQIATLADSTSFTERFPLLLKPDAAIWSARQVELQSKWYVVTLRGWQGVNSDSHVADLPAWTVVRKCGD